MRPWQKSMTEWPAEQLVAGGTTLLGALALLVFALLWFRRLFRSRPEPAASPE